MSNIRLTLYKQVIQCQSGTDGKKTCVEGKAEKPIVIENATVIVRKALPAAGQMWGETNHLRSQQVWNPQKSHLIVFFAKKTFYYPSREDVKILKQNPPELIAFEASTLNIDKIDAGAKYLFELNESLPQDVVVDEETGLAIGTITYVDRPPNVGAQKVGSNPGLLLDVCP